MTTQTTNNDILLSLWALEQNFYPTVVENEPMMGLFSGGQDSSTLAWFLYHAEPGQSSRQNLMHCVHLLQPDNLFMAQHAVNLSFWLGWHHTSIFPTQALRSEKEASYWRASLQRRVGACTPTRRIVNGHTETDKRETAFFKFVRAAESTDFPTTNESSANNSFALSYMGAYFGDSRSDDVYPLHRATHYSRPAAPAGVVAPVTPPNAPSVASVHRPLSLLTRKDTRLIVAAQRLPVYPDQTNFECHTTRAQLRYLVFPLLAKLGFTFFE